MNEKALHTLWCVSLMVIGVATVLILGSNLFQLQMPDSVTGLLGILELVSLPILAFTTVKKLKK